MKSIAVKNADKYHMPQPKDGYTVTTHGWDTAFTIPAGDVNQAIINKKSSPAGFDQDDPDVKLSGKFGTWQITQGGDGKNVRMSLPISDIAMTYKRTGKTVHFTSGTAIAEIELEFLPHTEAQERSLAKGVVPMALKPKLKSHVATSPVFDVVEVYDLQPTPGLVDGAVLKQTLQNWGNAHLSEFDHVFSVVNINKLIDKGNWAFVTPSYSGYAYLDLGGKVETSLFSVLCMTGGRSGAHLNQQVAFNAIPKGSIAGFLISQGRTLHDLVRPAIKQAYPGLTDDNFLMNDDMDTLYLKHGVTVDLKSVVHNGTPYYPKLTNLSVKSNGSLFTLTSRTTTKVAAGLTAVCVATHWYTLDLAKSAKGQTLKFKTFGQPIIVHSITQSKGSHLTQMIIAIVGAIAMLILGILTDGAGFIIGGLAIGLLLGADMIVPAVIEKVNKDDSPAIDLLRINAVDPIKWPFGKVFDLDYGKLNESLQLGGNPKFIWTKA